MKKSWLKELKFCDVSGNPKSSICWKIQLSITKTVGCSHFWGSTILNLASPLFKVMYLLWILQTCSYLWHWRWVSDPVMTGRTVLQVKSVAVWHVTINVSCKHNCNYLGTDFVAIISRNFELISTNAYHIKRSTTL